MKRAVNQPVGELVLYGGIFLKTWAIADAGSIVPQHAHVYDHLTMLVRGEILVSTDGEPDRHYTAPALLKIPARRKHTFLSLTDAVLIACIHASATADIAIDDEHHLDLED